MVIAIDQACKFIPKLNILNDVEALAKVRKIVFVVRVSKEEVDKVTFDLQMKIDELQLKLQLTTPLEVWEQRGVAIKESMAQIDVTIQGCDQLFVREMGL